MDVRYWKSEYGDIVEKYVMNVDWDWIYGMLVNNKYVIEFRVMVGLSEEYVWKRSG